MNKCFCIAGCQNFDCEKHWGNIPDGAAKSDDFERADLSDLCPDFEEVACDDD